MTGWVGNIEEATLENTNFRRVLFTGAKLQLTVMRLGPGEEIGVEMHDHLDQFLRIDKLSSIYAPPEHPPETVHRTKEEADAAEG